MRIPIVGVMGSGSEAHRERSSQIGRWLAIEGVHLLSGGGGGVMASVSEAFCNTQQRRGLVIGIIPCRHDSMDPMPGYPNRWVEIPIFTHLPLSGIRGSDPLSRNHINILSSDVIIALPGSAGTASETRLAVAYKRPIAAYLDSPDQIPKLAEQIPVLMAFEDVQDFVRSNLP